MGHEACGHVLGVLYLVLARGALPPTKKRYLYWSLVPGGNSNASLTELLSDSKLPVVIFASL